MLCDSDTIVAIFRFIILIDADKTLNVTWDYWNLSALTSFEVMASFICLCMPTLRLIIARVYPRARDRFCALFGIKVTPRQQLPVQEVVIRPRDPNMISYSTSYTVTTLDGSVDQSQPGEPQVVTEEDYQRSGRRSVTTSKV